MSLYSDFSTKQHPSSLRSERCSLWQSLSVRQARNSRPGTLSNWQCADTGSQRNAASAKKTFLKYRTPSWMPERQDSFKLILRVSAVIFRSRACKLQEVLPAIIHPSSLARSAHELLLTCDSSPVFVRTSGFTRNAQFQINVTFGPNAAQ